MLKFFRMKPPHAPRIPEFVATRWPDLLIAAILIAMIARGPLFFPDSPSYVEASAFRSPGYPLLIALLRSIAGEAYVHLLVAFQCLVGIFAIMAICGFLRRAMGLSPLLHGLAMCAFALPYFNPGGGVGNNILSEGLAYPLFLMACRYLIEAMTVRSAGAFYRALAWTVLLVLTRKQFLFMWPVLALAIVGLHFHVRRWKQTLLLALALLAAISVAWLAERTWNQMRHGFFGAIPFTGVQLVVAPLLFSTPEDVARMPSERHAEFFRAVESEASRRQLTVQSNPDRALVQGKFYTYFLNYNQLAHDIAWPEAVRVFGDGYESLPAKLVAADRGMIEVSWQLAKAHIGDLARLYVLNVLNGLGANNKIGISFVLLQVVAATMSLVVFIRRPSAPLATALLSALVLHLANVMAVALVEPTMMRYMFYTSILVTALLLVALGRQLGTES